MKPFVKAVKAILAAFFLAALAGCASTRLTVDDGRKLDEQLVSEMKAYGAGATALRTAVVKSAALDDKACSIQYELPFEAMTSYGLKSDDAKMAWVRALGINEKLSIIAADGSSGVAVGDIVQEVNGYKSSNALKMVSELVDQRDTGRPFRLKLASGKEVRITPIKVCRGRTVLAQPFAASVQHYHWSESIHPLQVFYQPLTPEEATWIVLWSQGLSEEGGARMKTYAFLAGSMKWLGIVALGFMTNGATAAVRSASAAGSASAGHVAAVQLAGQAASMMASAAANKASLSGISGVAGGVFHMADRWAFDHMKQLGMNPRAGLALHERLVRQGATANAFLLDEARLTRMQAMIARLPRGPEPVPASPLMLVKLDRPDTRAAEPADMRTVNALDVRNAVSGQ